MELSFDCVCGGTVQKDAEFGDGGEVDASATCERCNRRYILTITGFDSSKKPVLTR